MTEDEALRFLDHVQHTVRLGVDAMRLLGRVYDEVDLDPDLSVEVGTLLLRFQQHAEHGLRHHG